MSFAPEDTKAVGKIPSGLFIIATKHDGKIDGFLGSFVQQISFDPLLIALAMKPGRPAYDSVKTGNTFTINVAGDHDKSYLKLFWKGYDPDNNPFDELAYKETEHGGIQLSQALGSIDCKIKESYTPGDHELIIAEVLDSELLQSDASPLTHVRKNGLSY